MGLDLSGMTTRELLALWLADYFWVNSPKNDGRQSSGSSAELDFRWDEMEAVEEALRGRYARVEAFRQAALRLRDRALERLALWHVNRYWKWASRHGRLAYVSNRVESEVDLGAARVLLTFQRGPETTYSREEVVRMLDLVRRDAPAVGRLLQDLVRDELARRVAARGADDRPVAVPATLYLLAHWVEVDAEGLDVERGPDGGMVDGATEGWPERKAS